MNSGELRDVWTRLQIAMETVEDAAVLLGPSDRGAGCPAHEDRHEGEMGNCTARRKDRSCAQSGEGRAVMSEDHLYSRPADVLELMREGFLTIEEGRAKHRKAGGNAAEYEAERKGR